MRRSRNGATDGGRMRRYEPPHHHASSPDRRRPLTIVLLLTSGYLIAEAVAGWLTHSLALLADAGHMLTDVAGLGLALAP